MAEYEYGSSYDRYGDSYARYEAELERERSERQARQAAKEQRDTKGKALDKDLGRSGNGASGSRDDRSSTTGYGSDSSAQSEQSDFGFSKLDDSSAQNRKKRRESLGLPLIK